MVLPHGVADVHEFGGGGIFKKKNTFFGREPFEAECAVEEVGDVHNCTPELLFRPRLCRNRSSGVHFWGKQKSEAKVGQCGSCVHYKELFPIRELLYICLLKIQNLKRIIAKRTLREFWEKHPDCEQYLKTWYDIAWRADWKSPNDIKDTFASTSVIANNRVVFNIRGNNYRLVVKFNYERQWAFIRFIGTHAEYDKIDATTI